MKFDETTRRLIVSALDFLTANEEPFREDVETAVKCLNRMLENREELSPTENLVCEECDGKGWVPLDIAICSVCGGPDEFKRAQE